MSIWDVLQTVLLLIPVVMVVFVIGGALKNVRGGHKGKYRYSYFEKKK